MNLIWGHKYSRQNSFAIKSIYDIINIFILVMLNKENFVVFDNITSKNLFITLKIYWWYVALFKILPISLAVTQYHYDLNIFWLGFFVHYYICLGSSYSCETIIKSIVMKLQTLHSSKACFTQLMFIWQEYFLDNFRKTRLSNFILY